ncbi:hypothetical protein H7347_09250 [Corynebacterium sp. zg-331]|uniref:LGFP repeat-containing protein n=1 Tax=unclassified Corynebacterium TaxID=2624378 RepID=UPI00128BF522|nr:MULTISPECIES: hypothetical protein [unclassified Corynebacterium]MBC3186748.1 hypothetical protein [Corynebacterium sp. zg-331]MPV53230.1 hypothetical protein [Corynebacterium sp. zg331]
MKKTTIGVLMAALFLGACTADREGEAAPRASETPTSTAEVPASATIGQTPVPGEVAHAVSAAERRGAAVLALTTGEGQRYLVELSDGSSVVYSPDTGAQKIGGKIARIWMGEGALNAPVGLPVAAEEALSGERGWAQDFQRGRISWARDDKGQYQAEVQS